MTTRTAWTIGLAATAILALSPLTLSQEEAQPGWTAGVDLSLVSKYIWRGLVLNDDVAIQPEAYLTYGNMEVSLFTSVDTTDRPDVDAKWEFTRVEIGLDYQFNVDQFTFGFGGTFYDNPNTDLDSTLELMGLIGYDTFLQPKLELFWDVDSAEGLYLRLSGNLGEDLNTWSWNVEGALGFATGDYNEFYYGINEGGLEDLTVTAKASFRLTDALTLTPHGGVSSLIDSDLRDAVDDATNLFVGLTLSWAF